MLYLDAIVDAMLKGLGQQVASVRYNILTSALDVLLLLWTLPRWGIDGYFWSFTVTHGINFLLSLRRLLRCTRSAPASGFVLKVLLTALFCAVLFVQLGRGLLAPAGLFLTAGGYIVIFILLRVLWGVVGREDVLWLRRLLQGD